jgi:hypothetical protein
MADLEIINIDIGMNVEDEIKRISDSIANADVRRDVINSINNRELPKTKKDVEKNQWDQRMAAILIALKTLAYGDKFVPMDNILSEANQTINEADLIKVSKKLDDYIKANDKSVKLIKKKSNGRMIYSLINVKR